MKRLLALAVFGAVVAGCSQAGAPVTQPGVLRVAIQSDVKNLNPLLNSNTTDGMIARLMFEPLVSADAHGKTIPMLAAQVPTLRNGGISKDGLTITYHMRRGVKWTDGVPVTSADVKWSWQALMNPNNNIISRHGYDLIKSIDTPGPYTVIVHLERKFAPFVNTFFADSDQPYPIAPAHILAKYPNINEIPFNNDPNVSDGPFKFVIWVHGDRMEFARNPNFFMGKPKLKRIVIHIVPDESTTVNMLRTHEIDWMFEASVDNYPQVKSVPGIAIRWVNVNGYEDVQLNVQRPYLRDLRVRRAIAYGIDKQRLVQTLTFGQERIATEDQPPFMWAYDPKVTNYPYDPAKARKLLEEAGWSPGPDGIMRKNGHRLILVLTSDASNITRRRASVEIQAMLRKIGIEAEVKYYQADVLYAPVGEGGILQGGRFDLDLAGWYAGTDPDDSSQLTCKNVAPHGYNYSRYCSKAMDAAQQTALSHYDIATRKIAYARIQELLKRDVPEIFTYYERQMQPINVNFKGFHPNPVTESWNAWQWSI